MVRKVSLVAAALLPSLVLAGCASGGGRSGPSDTRYVARDVSTLYNAASDRMNRGQYQIAAALFDEVERQHPYSPWARRAQLMSAFNNYAGGKYTQSIQTSQRFLQLHPGNRDAPYAYYLIALCYYEQISDVKRDQRMSLNALNALNELIRRYPDSEYSSDARLKIDLVNDQLAGKEMEIGRFYERSSRWLAADIRFRNVVTDYQTTSHAPEALYRLVETNLALGLPTEARRYAAVLGANYPGSDWYQRAFTLIERHAPAGAAASAAQITPAPAPAPAATAAAAPALPPPSAAPDASN